MYSGKYANRPARRRRVSKRKTTVMLSLLLLVGMVIGGTVAYLITQSGGLTNTFIPAPVTTTVTEEFDGTLKKNVNVTNTSDVDVYVRVALVSYRVDQDGNHIGGVAEIPPFTPGDGWISHGGFYYYTSPVAANQQPPVPLIGGEGIALKSYEGVDADGGKQVIEVMAEAIQADGGETVDGVFTPAVTKAWGIGVNTDGTLKIN